jgi:hypothetical protein
MGKSARSPVPLTQSNLKLEITNGLDGCGLVRANRRTLSGDEAHRPPDEWAQVLGRSGARGARYPKQINDFVSN